MILECPKCQKRYLVDPRAVGKSGRTVRCANCAHQWFATPPEAVTLTLEEPEQPPVRPEKAERKSDFAVPAVRDAASTPLSLKLATAALAILVLFTAGVLHHDRVVAAVPALGKLYALAGIYSTDGVVVAELAYSKEAVGLKDQHLLSGYLVNTTKEPRHLPQARVRLIDEKGRTLQTLPMMARQMLAPGERKQFNRSASTSPGSVHQVIVELGSPFELRLRP